MMIQAVLGNPNHPEYVAYKGYYSMEEVMNGNQSSRMEMGGMM